MVKVEKVVLLEHIVGGRRFLRRGGGEDGPMVRGWPARVEMRKMRRLEAMVKEVGK